MKGNRYSRAQTRGVVTAIAAVVVAGSTVAAVVSPVRAHTGTPAHEWTDHYLPMLQAVSGGSTAQRHGFQDLPGDGGSPANPPNEIAVRRLPKGNHVIFAEVTLAANGGPRHVVWCVLQAIPDGASTVEYDVSGIDFTQLTVATLTLQVAERFPEGGRARLACTDYQGSSTTTSVGEISITSVEVPKLRRGSL